MVQNNNKWSVYFNSGQIDELEQIAGKMLTDLGYVARLQGDKDLSSAQLLRFKWLDWLNVFMHHITFFGVRGLIPLFLRSRDAFMQNKRNKY